MLSAVGTALPRPIGTHQTAHQQLMEYQSSNGSAQSTHSKDNRKQVIKAPQVSLPPALMGTGLRCGRH
jgi:hypothetical protein